MPCAFRQSYGKHVTEIVPPHPSDPIMGGPKCRSRREARALRATPKPYRRKSLTRLTPYAPIEKAFPWDHAPRYLIRDRDASYGPVFVQRLRAMGIRDRPIAPQSPWQNAYVERLIGSIRRECLDHMIVFGEAHLRRIVGAYAAYYNEARTHRSLNKDAPFHRAIQDIGAITSQPVLGGLHHQYCRI